MQPIKENAPLSYRDKLYYYDESLERNSHIYEQFILLAKGYWRPGLIRILTQVGLFDSKIENMYINPKRFNSMMSFISLQQGDFEYFEKTWRGLLLSLRVDDSSELSVEQKAVRVFYLLKGSTHYTSLNELSRVKDEYEKLFRRMFTKKSASLMHLHKFSTFDEDELLYLFNQQTKLKSNSELQIDIHQELVTDLANFRKNSLNFDDDSEKWLSSLTLVSLLDKSGFDYIAKQLDIPDAKSNIYKGIISLEIDTISSLFDELSREIPYDLQVLILRILKGEVSALKELILKR